MHGLFFDVLSTGVCTTKHWQTSGRLVQELNVGTVQAWMSSRLNPVATLVPKTTKLSLFLLPILMISPNF